MELIITKNITQPKKLRSYFCRIPIDTQYRLVYYKTAFGTIAQLDRASDSGSEGRRFESA